MNIFVLHINPYIAARYLCDKHCVKMTLETAQLLSTAHHIHNSPIKDLVYAPAHLHHPCTIWTATSASNYLWLLNHFEGLAKEYQIRYGKVHASYTKLYTLLNHIPPMPDIGLTPFAQPMPDIYKHTDPVIAYRAYYIYGKQHLVSYKEPSVMPDWLADPNAGYIDFVHFN